MNCPKRNRALLRGFLLSEKIDGKFPKFYFARTKFSKTASKRFAFFLNYCKID